MVFRREAPTRMLCTEPVTHYICCARSAIDLANLPTWQAARVNKLRALGRFGAQVLRRALGSFHLPGTAIVRWLDEHVQLRLSILLTYLFGKSVYAVQLLRWLGAMARYLRTLAQPLAVVLGTPTLTPCLADAAMPALSDMFTVQARSPATGKSTDPCGG